MGVDAVSPARDSTDHANVSESYIALAAEAPALDLVLDAGGDDACDHDGILDAGETGALTFSLLNLLDPGQLRTADSS